MLVSIALVQESGEVFGYVECDQSLVGAQAASGFEVALANETGWLHEEVWLPRPEPVEPPEFIENTLTAWDGLPEGAVVSVIDPETDIVAGSEIVDSENQVAIQLTAGLWRLVVSEVFPSLAGTFDVTVNEE